MKYLRALIVVFAVSILLYSCKKEFDSIGIELQNEEDRLGNTYTDTTTLIAYSIIEDSIVTGNLSNAIIGYVNDPVFGRTQAGFYTQFDLSGTNVSFGNSPEFDSLVLSLQYTGYFGDTLSPLSIKVYEITDDLESSVVYYSHQTTRTDNQNLTANPNYTLYPKPNTKVRVDTVMQNAQIRIRLSDNFGIQRILNNPALTDNASFQNNFKGLYVIAESTNGTGNLVYASLISSLSGLTLYYKENGVKKKYTFSISNANCKYYTYFNHFNYTQANSDLRGQILNGNTVLGQKTLYAQATAGVKTRIEFPYIKETYKDKNVVFNKAELVICNISEDEAHFFNPSNLGLQWVKSNNSISYLPDDAIYTNSSYFGGSYDAAKKEYRFRITKYIQQLVLQQTIDNGINLVVNGSGIRGNRLVFCGPNPDELLRDKRLRLELSYTTY